MTNTTKTKKQLQEELEILELRKKILEVKIEIQKLEDKQWTQTNPYDHYIIDDNEIPHPATGIGECTASWQVK